MNNLLLLPLIVPGIVLGIALFVFHVEAEIATGWPILGSLGGLIAGHVLIAIHGRCASSPRALSAWIAPSRKPRKAWARIA